MDALWYVAIYWTSAAVIFFQLDARLLVPLLGWLVGFLAMVWYFVPKLIERATARFGGALAADRADRR